jgi:hypothetical protein
MPPAPRPLPERKFVLGSPGIRGGVPTAAAPLRRSAGATSIRVAFLALALAVPSSPASAGMQEDHKRKVPIVDKMASGSNRQAFSGKVQSLDLGRKLLNVSTVQGGNTEIFPLGKGVRVATADGGKLKVKALAPGTNVLIYYEQKGDQRTVKEIIVLAAGPGEGKKPSPPS